MEPQSRSAKSIRAQTRGLWLGLLGERLDAVTLGFGVAVIVTVFAGRKMPVRPLQPLQETS